jgi:ATP-dependent Clp protease adaptor protein ClpS
MMADIGKQGPGNLGSGGGQVDTGGSSKSKGVQVLDRVEAEQGEMLQRKEQLDKENWWRVILHNDDIHTFDYVVRSITMVRTCSCSCIHAHANLPQCSDESWHCICTALHCSKVSAVAMHSHGTLA